ncbi:hypothetical protein EST38_g1484 [Candolleomyces aberdarensis]|uniref:GST N-terminal domain-containing protein n=1 Tax=Candolleomyces aberdarensis TaxID=2316362 RepID=A0A4Q2DYF4_9AGAR|nr:hypothetical protein EST38_g1484 [Candolleomyces aberdarensis]
MITLFDVPSTVPGKAWSLNMWRARFSLNYKGLPYKTQWIEYPEIAPVLKSHNIGPTKYFPDGSPYYSVPAILDIDDKTGEIKAALAESYDIAKYLDDAYPDTPRLLPDDETQVKAVKEFSKEFINIIWLPSLYLILCKAVLAKLNPASHEHFSKARARDLHPFYGKDRLEEIPLSAEEEAEEWKKIEGCFNALEKSIKGTDEKGQWFLGDQITFADFVIGGFLIWTRKILGEESEGWKYIKGWNDGRWVRFLDGLKEYSQRID